MTFGDQSGAQGEEDEFDQVLDSIIDSHRSKYQEDLDPFEQDELDLESNLARVIIPEKLPSQVLPLEVEILENQLGEVNYQL